MLSLSRWIVERELYLTGKEQAIVEKRQTRTQYQLAIYPYGIVGNMTQKIVNRLL